MTNAGETKALRGESLSRHSTIRIGGPAEFLFLPETLDELMEVLADVSSGCLPSPLRFFGRGSNILFADAGISGTLVSTKRMTALTVLPDGSFLAQAGVSMPYLSRVAASEGISGLSFMSGIPGTVGGGVAMNAGTPDGVFSRIVREVRVLSPSGNILSLKGMDLEFSYRHSIFSGSPPKTAKAETGMMLPDGGVILEVLLSGERADPFFLQEKGKESLLRRSERQPLDRPSLGSVFRNPQSDYAGRLIELSGLKGAKKGGILISPKHCNFFINEGDGTADQFLDLLEETRQRVKDLTGVALSPEVKTLF
jgi:UDP-N-acetylmuramate dehydrogenase